MVLADRGYDHDDKHRRLVHELQVPRVRLRADLLAPPLLIALGALRASANFVSPTWCRRKLNDAARYETPRRNHDKHARRSDDDARRPDDHIGRFDDLDGRSDRRAARSPAPQ